VFLSVHKLTIVRLKKNITRGGVSIRTQTHQSKVEKKYHERKKAQNGSHEKKKKIHSQDKKTSCPEKYSLRNWSSSH